LILRESLVTFPVFEPYPSLLCAVSTRPGGFSQGVYAGLNLGRRTGDRSTSIDKNREYFFQRLDLTERQVAFGEQLHTANALLVNRAGIYKRTDALITGEKNVFLAVLIADCFPVFLFDPSSAAVAVIHAGGRGTQAGIIENTLQLLKSELGLQVTGLIAAIGPGLQRECFEVRKDVYDYFAGSYFSPHREKDKKYLDLRQVIIDKLVLEGVAMERIEWSNECTMCRADKYYSHRRQGKNSGRMMGIIGIR
jgi:YfiH family protein